MFFLIAIGMVKSLKVLETTLRKKDKSIRGARKRCRATRNGTRSEKIMKTFLTTGKKHDSRLLLKVFKNIFD